MGEKNPKSKQEPTASHDGFKNPKVRKNEVMKNILEDIATNDEEGNG